MPVFTSTCDRAAFRSLKLGLSCAFLLFLSTRPALAWDNFADTWTATDALGRTLPNHEDVGPPRADRTVAIFYFLWLGPHSQKGGPWDVTKILATDPDAMQKPDSPLWGPMFAPHHWGESIFGYYNTDDPYVLRKHAQMLNDAGVDLVIFDVTNQHTYKANYMALLNTWSQVRAEGNKTPQVAFLCPFWDPPKVVAELYRDLYQPQIHPDLWFRWMGKPLILADPSKLGRFHRFAEKNHAAELTYGHTLGQSFHATNTFLSAGGAFPTWSTTNSGVTLQLRKDGPGGEILATKTFRNIEDNAWLMLPLEAPQPPGNYYLEISSPVGKVGWWSHPTDRVPEGQAFADGKPTDGDRNFQLLYSEPAQDEILQFFTFRKPQPDYFRGQTAPDMWSWLEIYPQHTFTNSLGQKEQMSVGVAQNAVSNRLGSLSEPGARGRSFHSGQRDSRPGAVHWGLNFAEQFNHALEQDPRLLFITGWNEWIAGRHPEFNGIRQPVMFVDQYDHEHSRDIEPMIDGHGDTYYYQLASFIRRYKGVRPPTASSPAKTILINSDFAQWSDVAPQFRDDIGDTFHRDFPGYANHRQYTNNSGRNDLVEAKIASNSDSVSFYVRTREPLTPASDPNWMWLLIDADSDHSTGWEGYDLILNRKPPSETTATIEHHLGNGWSWGNPQEIKIHTGEKELHLAIPRKLLSQATSNKLNLQFKWADNMPSNGDIVSWLDAGDSAPNGRFNYQFIEP